MVPCNVSVSQRKCIGLSLSSHTLLLSLVFVLSFSLFGCKLVAASFCVVVVQYSGLHFTAIVDELELECLGGEIRGPKP